MFIWRVVVFYFHLKQIQPYISGGWCNDREIVLAKWHIHLNPWKPFFVWHLFPLFCCCPALECYENDGTFHSNFTFLCPVQKLSGNFARVFWKRQIHNCEICFWFTLLEPCSSTTLNRRHRQTWTAAIPCRLRPETRHWLMHMQLSTIMKAISAPYSSGSAPASLL